jgi:tyrosyl-DNA phosphodiesterase 1
LNPKFLTSFYNQFGHTSPKPDQTHTHLRIIFPTEGYVQTSHVGVEHASSIILNPQYWSADGFPRKAFCRQEGRTQALDKNLYHAKFFIVTEEDNDEITDDTVLYFGSHNFSAGAWGNLEKTNTQLGIANWEVGVVFGPEAGS